MVEFGGINEVCMLVPSDPAGGPAPFWKPPVHNVYASCSLRPAAGGGRGAWSWLPGALQDTRSRLEAK